MCCSGARVRGWEYNGTIAWLMASVTCRMTDTGQRLALEQWYRMWTISTVPYALNVHEISQLYFTKMIKSEESAGQYDTEE